MYDELLLVTKIIKAEIGALYLCTQLHLHSDIYLAGFEQVWAPEFTPVKLKWPDWIVSIVERH